MNRQYSVDHIIFLFKTPDRCSGTSVAFSVEHTNSFFSMGKYPSTVNHPIIFVLSLQCRAYSSEEAPRSDYLPEDHVDLSGIGKDIIFWVGKVISCPLCITCVNANLNIRWRLEYGELEAHTLSAKLGCRVLRLRGPYCYIAILITMAL